MSRLFLAIWPSPEALDAIVRVQNELRGVIQRQGVRFVRPEKIHLTLRFYGEHADAATLAGRLAHVSGRPLELRTTAIGGFPGLHRPRIVWIGVAGDGLTELVQASDRAVEDLPIDERDEFSPHFTLARVSPGSKEVGRLVMRLPADVVEPPARWTVDELTLVETVGGGDYAVVSRFPLAGP